MKLYNILSKKKHGYTPVVKKLADTDQHLQQSREKVKMATEGVDLC